MIRMTASQALLEGLASEQRRVFGTWRALLLLYRATLQLPESHRRWTNLPTETGDITPTLRQMRERGEILSVKRVVDVHIVNVPYAQHLPIDAQSILFEANPYSVISHFSALQFHGLTEALPQSLYASYSPGAWSFMLPLGTSGDDWEALSKPPGRMPSRILSRKVEWHQIPPTRFFGHEDYRQHGVHVRVTSRERTLLDALQSPDLCGGAENVLRAWNVARYSISAERMIDLVERMASGVLRQRVGFLLEAVGINHPSLEAWRKQAKRGGSSRLFSSSPYAPTFSERWSLSLNGPVDALADSA